GIALRDRRKSDASRRVAKLSQYPGLGLESSETKNVELPPLREGLQQGARRSRSVFLRKELPRIPLVPGEINAAERDLPQRSVPHHEGCQPDQPAARARGSQEGSPSGAAEMAVPGNDEIRTRENHPGSHALLEASPSGFERLDVLESVVPIHLDRNGVVRLGSQRRFIARHRHPGGAAPFSRSFVDSGPASPPPIGTRRPSGRG